MEAANTIVTKSKNASSGRNIPKRNDLGNSAYLRGVQHDVDQDLACRPFGSVGHCESGPYSDDNP